MDIENSTITQNCSNYKKYDAYLSRLRYARVPMNNVTGSTVPLGLSSTNLVEFKIPSSTIINLSKSYITYQYVIPAVANNYGVSYEANQDFCTWCYYGDGGGLGIVDVNYCDRMTAVTLPIRTSNLEALGRDQFDTLYTSNTSYSANILPVSKDGLTTGTLTYSDDSYLEPQYLRFSALNTAMTVSRQIPLSSFKDTFLSVDKNVVFGRDMYLRFNSQYANRLGFYTTSTANANPGTNAQAFAGANAPTAFNSVYLFLAIEQNSVLVNSLKASLAAGTIKMQIPYTYTYRYGGTGSLSNMSITLTRQFGHKLKRLLYAPFCGTESGYTSFDHSNVNGTKVTQLQTSIDTRPLTDYQLNCFNPQYATAQNTNATAVLPTNCGFSLTTSPFGDDYREMKNKMILYSCLPSYGAYQTNWFYADTWGQQDFAKDILTPEIDDSNIDDGLNLLDADHVYTIQVNTPCINNANSVCNGSIVHYLFALFQRTLSISQEGISFE
jgi:hypothetical protein